METGREDALRTRRLMRELNEGNVSRHNSTDAAEIELVCECGRVACFETTKMMVTDFQKLCDSGGFVLAPGHMTPEADLVQASQPEATDPLAG
jgi:hypothetical protein